MAARRRELGRQIEHLGGAIAGGGLHASRALGQRIQAAEQDIAALNGAPARSPRLQIEQPIPRRQTAGDTLVDGNFENQIRPHEVPAFRQEIGRMIGPIRVRATPIEILLETQ